MIEKIRLTPNQLLELAQDAQVLRWDVETEPRVQFYDEELKKQQDAMIQQAMSKRFFNMSVHSTYNYNGDEYSNIAITMIVTWNEEAYLFIRRDCINAIETFASIEDAYDFIIDYLRKCGDPDYTHKIINY